MPLAPGATWAEFVASAAKKLKVAHVSAVYQAKSRKEVTSFDELGEIDELLIEVPPEERNAAAGGKAGGRAGGVPNSGAQAGAQQQQQQHPMSPPSVSKQRSGSHAAAAAAAQEVLSPRHSRVSVDQDMGGGGRDQDQDDDKYAKASTVPWAVRAMRSVGAGAAAAKAQKALPLTVNDVERRASEPGKKGQTKRRRKGPKLGLNAITALALLSFVGTGWLLFSRLQTLDGSDNETEP